MDIIAMICRSSADAPPASQSLDHAKNAPPNLFAIALFYVLVIAVIALRVAFSVPNTNQ